MMIELIKLLPFELLIVLILLIPVVVFILIFIAYKQGREISLWPPKVGPTPMTPASHSTPDHNSIDQLTLLKSTLKIECTSLPIASLMVREGEDRGTLFLLFPQPIKQSKFLIGPDKGCDILLNETYASKKHAYIYFSLSQKESISDSIEFISTPTIPTNQSKSNELLKPLSGVFSIADLHSKNGTLLNGELIGREMPLQNRDVIMIGHTILQFMSLIKNENYS